MNCATATGQLTGPLLMNALDAPRYLPGIRSLMIAQVVLIAAVVAQIGVLFLFNKRKQAQRVAAGKSVNTHDASMDRKFVQGTAIVNTEVGLDDDRTDWKNDEFIYVY
jgi:hypothetical protein